MNLQKAKTPRLNPQTKLFNHALVQSDKQKPSLKQYFSDIKGIGQFKNEIQTYIIDQLTTSKKIYFKNIIFRGPIGSGKSFVLQSIANEHNLIIFKTSHKDLSETYKKAQSYTKSAILITDLDVLEDFSEIESVADILMSNLDILIVGESRKEINSRLKKYGCFEHEIFFNTPNVEEREEILISLYQECLLNLQNNKLQPISFVDQARNKNGSSNNTVNLQENGSNLQQKYDKTGIHNDASTDNKYANAVNDHDQVLDITIKHPSKEEIKITTFLDIARYTPGFSRSDLCKLNRKALIFSENKNEILEPRHYLLILEQMNIKIDKITFDDIGGLEDVKRELEKSILKPSLHSEKYKKMGIKKPFSILLHGPPGCGKTLIAKALSNTFHFNFISIKGPELISKYVGDSEKELRSLFAKAKEMQPCVIFFDEIDSLCVKRGSELYNSRIVNQILTLMDGIEGRGDVFIIGATNTIDRIDEALLRPGRFDRIIEVPLPTESEINDIFKKCIGNIEFEDFGIENMHGFSGAEVYGVVNEAILEFASKMGNGKIEKEMFINVIERIRKGKKTYK